MEELLAHERAAEQDVHRLLKSTDVPLPDIAAACNNYRHASHAATLADFDNNEHHEARLWSAHTDVRKYFHKSLKDFRKNHPDRPVETRQIMKHFLEFLKQSTRYYREYISILNTASGGIAELKTIAHFADDGAAGNPHPTLPQELFPRVRDSCHRSLIYLGDLARYRAVEKLDKDPDFAPAIGYYDLAATLQPTSGLGHHQQAVIALEERNHLRAIYHLYRAITVQHPHPLATKNLELEFNKTNAAWDKGELIQKGPPKDPDASKNALIGWFVRLHSMCYKGESFRGHEELEQEVLSQLANVIKQRPLERPLMRMILVNMAAQWTAGENFQKHQSPTSQQSFFYFFRFNLRTFTTLLCVFNDDLRALLLSMEDHHVELTAKLSPIARRLLPCLRIYNNWLLPQIHMIQGLANEDSIQASVQHFWPAYAKTVDLIAQAFPIWDLEDVSEASYMLEEDADTLGFEPVTNEKTQKTWFVKNSNLVRPRFSDMTVVRLSSDEEMLQRVKDFLADGLYLANNDDLAPIHLRGTRVFVGDESNIDTPTVREPKYPELPKKEKPKPVSYAAAAANGHARQARPSPAPRNVPPKAQSRDAQLSRMVDDLVDDDEANNPITPPQQTNIHPAVVMVDEVPLSLQDSVPDLPTVPSKHGSYVKRPSPKPIARPVNTTTPPAGHQPGNISKPMSGQYDRLQSVSRLWEDGAQSVPSSGFPSGLPTGTLGSPAIGMARGHSRVNSASSIRSRTSMNGTMSETVIPNTMYGSLSSLDQTGMGSPLLFGAGGSLWSNGPVQGYRKASPPNGQG